MFESTKFSESPCCLAATAFAIRIGTNLHDLSVYAAIICSMSLNCNKVKLQTLQGKRQVTFLLRFLLIASVAHVTSILCYHLVGLDLLPLSESYTIDCNCCLSIIKERIGRIRRIEFLFSNTLIITRVTLVCYLIQNLNTMKNLKIK